MKPPAIALQSSPSPLQLSTTVLNLLQTRLTVTGQDCIPDGPLVVVSNHRSLLDPFTVMVALQRDIRFACHFFMTRVPLLNVAISRLNCLPLEQHGSSQGPFIRRALGCLRRQETVGIFPEGGALMTRRSTPHHMAEFQPGFAHLALRSRQAPLAVLPVAIKVRRDLPLPDLPMSLFRWFDPVDPVFQTNHPHPVVLYREVTVAIAPPIWLPLSSQVLEAANASCLSLRSGDSTERQTEPLQGYSARSLVDRQSAEQQRPVGTSVDRKLALKADIETLTGLARSAIQQRLNE